MSNQKWRYLIANEDGEILGTNDPDLALAYANDLCAVADLEKFQVTYDAEDWNEIEEAPVLDQESEEEVPSEDD